MIRKPGATTFDQREAMARYYEANREKMKARSQEYRERHREQGKRRAKRYSSNPIRKAKRAARERLIYQASAEARIRTAVRCRVSRIAKLALRSAKVAGRTVELLGCSIGEFRECIAAKFLPGMSWDNFGEWHLDHILPCALFDMTCVRVFRKCFHFSNYQPLWALDNMKKGQSI